MPTGTILTIVIGLGMIILVLYLNRENWRGNNKKGVANQAATVVTPPPVQTTRQQQSTGAQQTPATNQPPKRTKWWKWGIAVFAVIVIMWVWQSLSVKIAGSRGVTPIQLTSRPSTDEIPAEIALPIICGCESSGIPGKIQHFAEDGKTPLPNKQGSTAIGGCQIKTDVHEERAKKMGFDIRTPEGNFGYAKVLYNESDPPTKHWEGKPGDTTRHCWEPKLVALGYTQGIKFPIRLGMVEEVPVSNWSEEIDTTGHKKVCWGRIDLTKGGVCEVMLDKDPKMVFPIKSSTGRIGLRTLQFKCSESGAKVEVTSSN